MLISLLSFHLINSFLLIQSSSSVEKKCSINNDCDYQLICNQATKTCTCPKSYFWHDDTHACFGCAPGWIELNPKQCLLFAMTQSPGVTWNQAETSCHALLARPLIINNTEQFIILKKKIDDLSNGMNILTAIVYFHQGAWIKINSEWMESSLWCDNNNNKRDSFNCIQLRQNNITNTFCLRYVSCNEQSQFICEASPVLQSVLEQNIAETKRSMINKKVFRRSITTHAPVLHPAPGHPVTAPTKKPSSFNFDSFSNVLNGAFSAIGHVSNAVGSYYGSKQQNQQSNIVDTSNNQMPQALLDNDDDDGGSKNLLVYGGIGLVVILFLLIIIISIICCLKKNNRSNSKSSIRSNESYSSFEE